MLGLHHSAIENKYHTGCRKSGLYFLIFDLKLPPENPTIES
jgi:hypothetical protein